MRKVLHIIRNIIFGIVLVIYLSVIICASTLVLNRNDYGYTEFGNKALLDIKEDTGNYKKGQLVITEKRLIDKLKVGDEVFVYQTNQQEKTIKIVSSKIKNINSDENTPYITIDSDNSSWGQDYIAGASIKVYDSLGSIISFAESKWIFFAIFIVPCFFILLYEIYSVIIVIKFDGEEVVMENAGVSLGNNQSGVDNVNVVTGQNDMDALMQQINSLQTQLNNMNGQPGASGLQQPVINNVAQPQETQQPVVNNTVQPQESQQPVINNVAQPQETQQPVINNAVQPQAAQQPVINNAVQPQETQQPVVNNAVQPQEAQQPVINNVAQPQVQPIINNIEQIKEEKTDLNQSPTVNEEPQITNIISTE